jgi:hypothetical protein
MRPFVFMGGTEIITMERSTAETDAAQIYVLGDAGAGKEVGLPQNEIRKLRVNGKLAGAYAKTGHRSIIYHRVRLRQRVNEAFKT